MGYSPEVRDGDALIAYEGSYTDGPFITPLGYRRDNLTANWPRRLSAANTFG